MHSLRRRDQSRCALERAVRRERQPKRIEIVGLARCQASNIGHGRLATRYSLLATRNFKTARIRRAAPWPGKIEHVPGHNLRSPHSIAGSTIYRRPGRRRTVSFRRIVPIPVPISRSPLIKMIGATWSRVGFFTNRVKRKRFFRYAYGSTLTARTLARALSEIVLT